MKIFENKNHGEKYTKHVIQIEDTTIVEIIVVFFSSINLIGLHSNFSLNNLVNIFLISNM